MKKYIITYHFRSNSRDYSPFYEAIKANFPESKHIIESAWIVNSDKTAKEISHLLIPHLHFENYDCDTLFVAEIDKTNVEGMIGKSLWSFITDKKEDDDKKARRKEITDHEMMDMASKIKRYTVHQMFPTGATITNETCGYVVEEKSTGKFLDGKAYKMIFEDKNDPLKPSLYVGNDKCEFSGSKKDDWRGVFYYFELNGNEER